MGIGECMTSTIKDDEFPKREPYIQVAVDEFLEKRPYAQVNLAGQVPETDIPPTYGDVEILEYCITHPEDPGINPLIPLAEELRAEFRTGFETGIRVTHADSNQIVLKSGRYTVVISYRVPIWLRK